MQIQVRLKAAGRRRDVLCPAPYEIPETVSSLRELLTALTASEVDRYNRKDTEGPLFPFLSQSEIEDRSLTGKVGFGRVWSDRKADPEQAAANAVRCWEDGLVRVFMDDEEITGLDAPLLIREDAVFTFLRLTFLAGRLW